MTTIHFEESMEGLVIDRISRGHDFTMPTKHFHSEYEIYYLITGDRYYFIDKETYYCPTGSLVLIEHNLVHKTSIGKEPFHDRILIELHGGILDTLMEQLGFSTDDFFHHYTGVYPLPLEKQEWMKTRLLDIAEEVHNKTAHYDLVVKMKLMELFVFVLRFQAVQKPCLSSGKVLTYKYQLIEKVASYLSEAYAENESLEEISKKFYVNRCYLSRIFKEVTGFTISEYTNIQRIKQAKQLLAVTNDSLSDIAEAVGFHNNSYFVHVFKTYTETTPYHYRKQLQHYQ